MIDKAPTPPPPATTTTTTTQDESPILQLPHPVVLSPGLYIRFNDELSNEESTSDQSDEVNLFTIFRVYSAAFIRVITKIRLTFNFLLFRLRKRMNLNGS
jgi:hypothetical protein